jgi:23S rRNA (adenine2503-C2)-methyltransferase
LDDGETIETVLMSYDQPEHRRSLCVSSQAGCAMGCVFCATGQMGLRRHLTAGEIVAQVLAFERQLREENSRLTNIVFMGMGEPLDNYDATVKAIRRLTDPAGFHFGGRRITVSTVGLAPGIRKLAGEGFKVGLAISLQAATDEERKRLVPSARRWSLAEILDAGREYATRTGRRISIEWTLIEGENDTPEQAHALGRLIQDMHCHVNLIPLNPTEGYAGARPGRQRIAQFQDILSGYCIRNTVRVRRGIDIQAGCGQLRKRVNTSRE